MMRSKQLLKNNFCKEFLYKIIFSITIIFLTGCGFHLREQPHKLYQINISSNQPYSHFVRHLSHYFKPSEKSDDITLLISSIDQEQILIAVGGIDQTRQYRLRTTVHFQLLDHCKRILLNTEKLQGERIQTIQSSDILSTNNETDRLYQQIETEIADALYYRLNSKQIKVILNQNWNRPC